MENLYSFWGGGQKSHTLFVQTVFCFKNVWPCNFKDERRRFTDKMSLPLVRHYARPAIQYLMEETFSVVSARHRDP